MPDESVVHVIDDDEPLRESLAFLLGTAHLEVRTYESATSFLAALARAEPGCIITDVRMPGISGVELLRRLKGLGAAFPVIVITGHGDVPLAVEAMKLGAVDFLEKPFEDDVLLAAVRSTIAFDLGISPRTVEIYRANLMTKMKATSLSDLVRMALVCGLLVPSSGPEG